MLGQVCCILGGSGAGWGVGASGFEVQELMGLGFRVRELRVQGRCSFLAGSTTCSGNKAQSALQVL